MDKLNKFHYHEALDRTMICIDHMESALGKHPVIQNEEKAKELYEKSVETLGNLHQLLGEVNFSNE